MPLFSRMTNAARRIARVRAKVRGTALRPRLSVARSLKHITAQVIDDNTRKTLASASDADLGKDLEKTTKTEKALAVGKLIAERAKAKGVSTVVFDRRDKQFHGRVRAVAEGAREGGLIF